MVDYNYIMFEILNNCKWQNFYNIMDMHIKNNTYFTYFLINADAELNNIMHYYNLTYHNITVIIKMLKKEFYIKKSNIYETLINKSMILEFDG